MDCNYCKNKNTKNCNPDLYFNKCGTVFDHTLEVLKNLPENSSFELQMAALFHDIGKNEKVAQYIDGKCKFIHHEFVGKNLAKKRLISMHFSKESLDKIVYLIEHHMDLKNSENISDKTLRKFIREAKDYRSDLLDLIDADGAGTYIFDKNTYTIHGLPAKKEIRKRIEQLLKESEINNKKFVYFNGNEIMQIFNLNPGIEVGKIMKIQTEIIDEFGTKLDKNIALKYIITKYNEYKNAQT